MLAREFIAKQRDRERTAFVGCALIVGAGLVALTYFEMEWMIFCLAIPTILVLIFASRKIGAKCPFCNTAVDTKSTIIVGDVVILLTSQFHQRSLQQQKNYSQQTRITMR